VAKRFLISLWRLSIAELFGSKPNTPLITSCFASVFLKSCSSVTSGSGVIDSGKSSPRICIVTGSLFQAIGKAVYSMINSICRQLVVLLPAAYVLAQFGNVNYVWFAFLIAEVASMILTAVFFKKVYCEVIKPL
jgi:hypothetical protein